MEFIEQLSKILAPVWRSQFENNPKQRAKSFVLKTKLPLQLNTANLDFHEKKRGGSYGGKKVCTWTIRTSRFLPHRREKKHFSSLILFHKNFFAIQTLKKDIKPVAAEKKEIEYGDKSKLLAHLDSSDNRKSEAKINTIVFRADKNCKTLRFPLKNLLEEIKLVVTEKYELQFRHK